MLQLPYNQRGDFMTSTISFIKTTALTTLGLYVLFAGLMAIAAVLSWVTWEFVGEWLGRIGIIARLVVVITGAIAFITGLIRK